MKTVIKFLRPHIWLVALSVLLKVLGAFAELAIPRLLAEMIDVAIPAMDMDAVITGGVIMLILAVSVFIFNATGNVLSGNTSGAIAYDIREALFEKTIHLEASATDRLGTASLTSRLTSDTYNITSFFTRLQRVGIKGPIMLVGGVIMTLTIDFRLSLVLIFTLPFVVLTVYLITTKATPIYHEEQEILDRIVSKVDETASGIRVIKALSRTEYEKERFRLISEELSKKEIYAGRLMSATKPITDLLLHIGFCLVVLVGAILSYYTGYSAAGALLAFMTYFTLILNSTILMTRIFVQLSRSIASSKRIEEVLLTENALTLYQPNDVEADNDGYITFRDVSFSYNKRRNNLEDISFSIRQGDTLGIIGATGSGKSTIVNLLLRLYDPDCGSILIDGRDIRTIPKDELHSMFGVAFQNDFMFAGTIRENVEFFREGNIDTALEVAQASDFVSVLDDGTEHSITTGGTNVSGGQRQRLFVARALFGEPKILILDDASSALDYKTDRNLRRAIAENIDTTTIIIAQRISSIKNADLILVIDDGKIIGKGTHDELMASLALYRDIADMQMGERGGSAI